jgi:hypothetical protein
MKTPWKRTIVIWMVINYYCHFSSVTNRFVLGGEREKNRDFVGTLD